MVEQSGIAFILTVIDGQLSGGGGVDKIRMKIYNKNTNQVYYDNQFGASDADNPVTPVETGGTVVIVNLSAATSANNSITKLAESESVPGSAVFNVRALPNPTEHEFTLYLEGGSNEKVQLVIYDAVGRKVKRIERGDGSGAIRFGEVLRAGVYIVEVRQGENRKTIKLIKQ